jgi:hypothetical protein
MGKKKKTTKDRGSGRTRTNPLTGEVENVPGAKAGKRRTKLPAGHPLRTHDLNGPIKPKAKQGSKQKSK